ncbi:hypothetical protein DdX_16632 [Ditylenchus destructor]|uniref:Uncharacterized protein n=1 Tax=Ditylenchus destructor TaxID=166010 RepID=A0AAD4MNL0_9BILA|nr:hypothetical protein DdX_16632 [Ditylenchus destructor]
MSDFNVTVDEDLFNTDINDESFSRPQRSSTPNENRPLRMMDPMVENSMFEEEENDNPQVERSLNTTTASRRKAASRERDQTLDDLEDQLKQLCDAARLRFAHNPNTTVERVRGFKLEMENRDKWGPPLKMTPAAIQMASQDSIIQNYLENGGELVTEENAAHFMDYDLADLDKLLNDVGRDEPVEDVNDDIRYLAMQEKKKPTKRRMPLQEIGQPQRKVARRLIDAADYENYKSAAVANEESLLSKGYPLSQAVPPPMPVPKDPKALHEAADRLRKREVTRIQNNLAKNGADTKGQPRGIAGEKLMFSTMNGMFFAQCKGCIDLNFADVGRCINLSREGYRYVSFIVCPSCFEANGRMKSIFYNDFKIPAKKNWENTQTSTSRQ